MLLNHQKAQNQPKTVSELLANALVLLGPNGENWCKGRFNNETDDKFCMLGALGKAGHGHVVPATHLEFTAATLISTYVGPVPIFNDRSTTTFKDVKNVMCKAIKAALDQNI